MTIPQQDPYEVTTEQLVEADRIARKEISDQINTLEEQRARIDRRLDAYQLTLEAYRSYRPVSANGSYEPYAGDSALTDLLRGLSQWQKLLVLGLINDRRVLITPAGKLLHRIGAISGKWKHVPSRLYKMTNDHPDIFVWDAPGEYEILPGAEKHLPQSNLALVALANGWFPDDPAEEYEGHKGTVPNIIA